MCNEKTQLNKYLDISPYFSLVLNANFSKKYFPCDRTDMALGQGYYFGDFIILKTRTKKTNTLV